MQELPERTDHFVHLPVTPKDVRRLLAEYSAAVPALDDPAEAPPDSLSAAGVKSTAHRVGLLKALALADADSWLHTRLRCLVYAAEELTTNAEQPRKLVLFAHHERVMDRLERTLVERLGKLQGSKVPLTGLPFNNSASLEGGGGGAAPPFSKDWAKFSSRPSANQKFSLALSAPISFDFLGRF